MKGSTLLTLALLLPASAVAQQEVSHSYIDLGYVAGRIDSTGTDDLDFRGLDLELATEFSPHIHGYAQYSEARVDQTNVNADIWGIGAGADFSPLPSLSVYGRLGYVDVNGSATFGSTTLTGSADGYRISGGVRYLVTDRLELRGSYEYVDLDESGDDDYIAFGGDYFLTDVFAFSFEVDVYDDAEAVVVGARIYPSRDRQARRR